jgi:hypothetical protein
MSKQTMQRAVLAIVACVLAVPALAQLPIDDSRVRYLESEVSRLQREIDSQSRRIEALEQAVRIASPGVTLAPGLRMDTSPAWLVAASWDRLKIGMKSTEVIAVLGRPTSTRSTEDGKLYLLFYAMEVGHDAVLSGTIRLDTSGAVTEINRPVLK